VGWHFNLEKVRLVTFRYTDDYRHEHPSVKSLPRKARKTVPGRAPEQKPNNSRAGGLH
jgi:hypothetical protein